MRRRRALQLVGAGLFGGLAGCAGDTGGPTAEPTPTPSPTPAPAPEPSPAPFEHPGTLETTFATNGEYPADENPADGYPPAFPDPPAAPDTDPANYRRKETYGETVRLAPIEDVYAWYRRGEARFVDARGLEQYEQAHVYGAVFSGAQPRAAGGGIDGWDPEARVVTYCACPHHLSSIRAAGLQKAGFTDVFALDDGFAGGRTEHRQPWADLGYPMEGTVWVEESTTRADVRLDGRVDDTHAGAYAWAITGEQREAAPIEADGRFSIHVRFAGVDERTPVTVRTPAYSVTGPLGELASGEIRGP